MRLALYLVVVGMFVSATSVLGADVSLDTSTSKTPGTIRITGEIGPGDEERFRVISLRVPSAVVMLESDGGSLLPALEIGKMIRIAGYETAVPQGKVCASACALIWLAGTSRELRDGGRVGFHAAYRDRQGKLEEAGSANALVGSYLTSLGLPTKAVLFATSAPPDAILWLTNENSKASGIDYTQSASVGAQIQTQPVMMSTLPPAPARITPRLQAPRPVSADLIKSLSLSGERWIRIDGFGNLFFEQKTAILPKKGWRKFWILYDYSSQIDSDAIYEMKFAEVKCDVGALRFPRILIGDGSENTREVSGKGYYEPAPGSQERALVFRLCGIKRPA